jgi:hypothetical protein
MLREIKGTQRLPRQLFAIVDGTGTAAIREGATDFSLADDGTGSYTLTITKPFARKPVVVITCATTDCYAETVDATNSASVIKILTKNNADAATDAVFHVMVQGWDTATVN